MVLSRFTTAVLLLLSWPAYGASIGGDDPQVGRLKIVEDTVYWHHRAGLITEESYNPHKAFRLQYCSADGKCEDIRFTVTTRSIDGRDVSRTTSKLPWSYMKVLARDWRPFWQTVDSVFMPVHQAAQGRLDINVSAFPEWKRQVEAYVTKVLNSSFAGEIVLGYVDAPPRAAAAPTETEVAEVQPAAEAAATPRDPATPVAGEAKGLTGHLKEVEPEEDEG